jgi:2-dehydro-3-deoxy-D-arabinonate dehydratase
MQLCKFIHHDTVRAGLLRDGLVLPLDLGRRTGITCLADVLHAPDSAALVEALAETDGLRLEDVRLLAPIDRQEVWAAGVTYRRSREARERESAGAARFYDLVYRAERPELFFKATPHRVSGPGQPVRVRRDSRWSVPEPELALVLAPDLRLAGFTIGNDMSARDIEGENPLYLPQAKVYEDSCALGPVVTLAGNMPPADQITIRLQIERAGRSVFDGSTTAGSLVRSFDDLVGWLGRDNRFPDGAFLLTGTGVVPPDDFSLAAGDVVHIDVAGVGRLTNPVIRRD